MEIKFEGQDGGEAKGKPYMLHLLERNRDYAVAGATAPWLMARPLSNGKTCDSLSAGKQEPWRQPCAAEELKHIHQQSEF